MSISRVYRSLTGILLHSHRYGLYQHPHQSLGDRGITPTAALVTRSTVLADVLTRSWSGTSRRGYHNLKKSSITECTTPIDIPRTADLTSGASKPSMESPRIAIIGGGPGGLMLARLLKLQGISFRLFESDESHLSRSQGGTLDIHSDSGQLALKEACLFSEFEKHARHEGAALKTLGKDGTIFWADDGPDDGQADRPEIDRTTLRKILLDSLDDGMVTWGRKVVRVEEDSKSIGPSPRYNVEFEGGETENGFELIIGADGAFSKVRPLLSEEKPFYSGISCVEARVENVDVDHPDLSERVGKGTCFQAGDAKALISQRLGDGSVRTYAMLRVPEDWSTTCNIDWEDTEKSKRSVVEKQFVDWEPLGQEFVLRSDGPLTVRPLYMLPVKMHWKTRPGVTVIGDAAHLMTPFAGQGVNLALVDALDLSHAIRSHVGGNVDWRTVLQQFEDRMFTRAHVEATKTYSNLTIMFSGDGADVIAQKFGELMGGPEAEGNEESTER